jgi:hypothetical protein
MPNNHQSNKGTPQPKVAKKITNNKSKQQPKKKGPAGARFASGYAQYAMTKIPAAVAMTVNRRKPVFTRTADGFRVVGSELITIIQGSPSLTTGAITQIDINPGLPGAFPELSQIAPSFERYKTNSLSFTVVPTGGSSATGLIVLAPQYDAADPVPVTELGMCQYKNAKEIMLADTSGNLTTRTITCFPKSRSAVEAGTSKYLFTRPGALPANLDVKTYDCVALAIGAFGTTTGNVARLWANYDFELVELQPSSSAGALASLVGVPVSSANMFGTTVVNQLAGSIIVASATTNTITFVNMGEYFVSLLAIGTGVSALGGSSATASVVAGAASVGAAATTGRITFAVRTTAPNQTLVLTSTATTLTTLVATITYANYLQLTTAGSF